MAIPNQAAGKKGRGINLQRKQFRIKQGAEEKVTFTGNNSG
jgi:hypothetical protein